MPFTRKRLLALTLMTLVLASVMACSESEGVKPETVEIGNLFKNNNDFDLDTKKNSIKFEQAMDSLEVSSLDGLGGAKYYLALDEDLVDPEIDWNHPLKSGSIIKRNGSEFANIVVLDEDNRVVSVWQIKMPKPASSASEISSSSKMESSSSEEVSSSSVPESSSSEPESSSSEIESSSSDEVESSSSVAPSFLKLEDLAVDGGKVFVDSSKVYVELPYGTDLSAVRFASLDSAFDLTRLVEMQLDDQGVIKTFDVIAGVQLPGSSFDKKDVFWGTTSDAMAKEATVALITMSSEANLTFGSSKVSMTSKVIDGSLGLITAGHKLAGGFYFAGSFDGEDCNALYNEDGDYPGLENSDFSKRMIMGQKFMGRPSAFEVSYAYNHKDGKSKDFPQKSLIYVILASAKNKAVAVGSISNESTQGMSKKVVSLNYGKDPEGILSSGYALPEGLELGTGEEDVAKIYVMFASSAFAHVASTSYRGAEGSELIVDEFKLIY